MLRYLSDKSKIGKNAASESACSIFFVLKTQRYFAVEKNK